MKSLLFFASFTLLSFVAISQGITMSVESTIQGKFKTESIRRSGVDKIDVNSFTQELTTAREAGSGMATGRRQYQPIIIHKNTGDASPQFFQALVTNESLKRVVFEFYKTDMRTGQEMAFYTVTLEDAFVTGYKQYTPFSETTASGAKAISRTMDAGLYDEIRITFRKITVESNSGKTMATDNVGAVR